MAKVELFAGTTSIGVATTAPFSVNWNTTTAANGNVNVTAVAHDAAGNTTTSAPVAVTVTNAAAGGTDAGTTAGRHLHAELLQDVIRAWARLCRES